MNKIKLCIILIMIFAVALTLGGCSSAKTVDSAAATKESTTTKEPSDPTVEVEATPELSEDQCLVPLDWNWTVVTDTKVEHRTNIGGFLNDQFGITVGYAGEIHYTEDGGKTWPRAQNSSLCRFSMDIVDEQIAWCGGNGGNVRVTKDGGKTWSAVNDINLGAMHSNMDFLDDTTGWIATAKKLVATKDGGETWTELTVPEEAIGIGAISLRTPENGYLLSNNGLFFTTTDGGETWNKHDLKFEQYEVYDAKGAIGLTKSNMAQADICFTDEQNGTMVFTGIKPGEGGRTWCLTTTDGGETWNAELFQAMEGFMPARVYLSGDGKYLTLGTNDNHLLVYQRNE